MAWEYQHIQIKTEGIVTSKLPEYSFSEINRLAAKGWELIHVIPMRRAFGRTDYVVFVLRRELV